LEIRNPATAIYWLSPFVYRMLDLIMGHGRRHTALIKCAALAVGFVSAVSAAAPAQERAGGSCAAAIRTVLNDIARRDLDTSEGPPLNAFLTLNPNAVAQAEALDRRAALGETPGPLFCVPVAAKDNFDTYDMPATVGSLALVGNRAPRDAPFVARLRKAGAIIVGKTNMDEFAMGLRGLSGTGGRVGNAYDTEQSAGGSSSGSGAACADEPGSASVTSAFTRVFRRAMRTHLLEWPRWPLASLASAAVTFPAGLDARGMPAGLELMGRPGADEALVALMGAFETVRGPLPRPKRMPGRADLTMLDIPASTSCICSSVGVRSDRDAARTSARWHRRGSAH
jgi:Asp-tRNA(Asn)/Glu-tRNA(Gln) amidotransferase A subunit family amidase